METPVKQVDKPLTVREKLAMYLVILLIKLVKPSEYSSEYEGAMKEVKELMDKT